jgi:hypothetical protein
MCKSPYAGKGVVCVYRTKVVGWYLKQKELRAAEMFLPQKIADKEIYNGWRRKKKMWLNQGIPPGYRVCNLFSKSDALG